MEVYVATQPIFDIKQSIYAYEILYRKGNVNTFGGGDPDEASSKVIIDGFLNIGIERLTGGKPAFINFTEKLLKQGIATLLPTNQLVVEVLEDVAPESEIVNMCKYLKEKGYRIALDDFVFKPEFLPLVEIADIIKVDWLATTDSEKKRLAKEYGRKKIIMLAEKIETIADYEFAKELGYTLFQGFFFSKPQIMAVNDIPPLKFNHFQLISKVNQRDINFNEVSQIISRDINLSYKILRLVNSSAFGFKSKIESIKQAIVILGENELRKWVSLIALKGVGDDKPDAIIRFSLIRAKFAELIADRTSLRSRKSDVFLMGLFSMLDVFMNRPLVDLLQEIQISQDIKDTLIEDKGIFLDVYNLVIGYEKGQWEEVSQIVSRFGINEKIVSAAYLSSVAWCDDIINSN